MLKVNNKDIRTTPLMLFWCFYCKLRTYFTPCSVSIDDFEQVNADWEDALLKTSTLVGYGSSPDFAANIKRI